MKNIYQKGLDRINEMAYQKTNHKKPNKIIIVGILFFITLWLFDIILALVLNEEIVANCAFCQEFISFMSSIIPGVKVIANTSPYPNAVALQVSLSWALISFIFIILVLNKEIESGFQLMYNKKSFLIVFLWILNELIFGFGISYFHGVGFGQEDTRAGLLYLLTQNRIGLGILIFFMVFYEATLLIWFFSYIKIIFKNISKENNNE